MARLGEKMSISKDKNWYNFFDSIKDEMYITFDPAISHLGDYSKI